MLVLVIVVIIACIIGLVHVLWFLAAALKNPGCLVDRLGRWAYIGCHLAIVGLMFADWARGSVVVTPLMMALDGVWFILIPGALSVMHLAWFTVRGWDAIWGMFTLSVLEFLLFIPVLILTEHTILERGVLVSFLSPVPMLAMALTTLTPFLSAPSVTQKIPNQNTRLWRIAYLKREGLLTGIQRLASEYEWDYLTPASILEAGSATGHYRNCDIAISTVPSLLPFQYRVQVEFSGTGHLSTKTAQFGSLTTQSWFDQNASMDVGLEGLVFNYQSALGIPVAYNELKMLVETVTSEVSPERTQSASPIQSGNSGDGEPTVSSQH